jgi:hypothetical protein
MTTLGASCILHWFRCTTPWTNAFNYLFIFGGLMLKKGILMSWKENTSNKEKKTKHQQGPDAEKTKARGDNGKQCPKSQ